jgi:predicted permease
LTAARTRALAEDLRHALRGARRHRAFSALVIAILALGIGLNSALFSAVNALLLRPSPVADPARLVHVYTSSPREPLGQEPDSFPDFESIRAGARSFASVAAYAWFPLALERGDRSDLVMAEAVTGNYFATVGVGAARGRTVKEDDDRPEAPGSAVVLSDDGWRRLFGRASDVLGRQVRLNGRTFTIVGVAPRGFRGLVRGFGPDLWLPIHAALQLPTGITIALGKSTPGLDRLADRGALWLWVTGRLKQGATVEEARADVASVASGLRRDFPESNARRQLVAVSAADVRVSPLVDRILAAGSILLLALFGLGLLLAATNVATLFLARALGRRREIATRLALGAPRGRVVLQLFAEGLVLALAGGALGLSVAHASDVALQRIHVPLLQWPLDVTLAPGIDLRVLLFALGAALVTAVTFAMAPALEATRGNLVAMLREAGSASPRRLRTALVATQVAIAMLLLTGGSAGLGALIRAAQTDPGFDTRRAALVTLSPELLGYSPERIEETYARVRDRIAEIPGVETVALASHVPLTAAVNFGEVAPATGDPRVAVDVASVDPAYFDAMGIRLVAGRSFAPDDGPRAPRVVVVNETLARRLWPGALAIGQRLADGAEVVGVARDGRYRTLGEPPRPFVYHCLAQDPRGTRTVIARTRQDPRALLPAIHAAVRSVDPRIPLGGAGTLAGALANALFVPRLSAAVLGAFAALGLLLAGLGVAGLVAYLSAARSHEIGLRVALGASRTQIVRLLAGRGLRAVAAGLLIGLALVAASGWALSRVVAGFPPAGPATVFPAAALLAAIAILAALIPALRAAGLDPAQALREE